uniref:Uncharacterized protein n=1 Tax=Romanomermis culicivorax TaxID=13658 RepID=A0A915J3M4_ROMCU
MIPAKKVAENFKIEKQLHNFREQTFNVQTMQNTVLKMRTARDVLEQLNTTAARITNNVSTIQTIDQIVSAISDQLQAQQLQVQCKIKEKAQITNARFTALAEQMQKLISTTTAVTTDNNPPTPRPPPASFRFPCKDMHDI